MGMQPGEADRFRLETPRGRLAVDPALGNIAELTFRFPGRDIVPLHAAHWVGRLSPDVAGGMIPIERNLAGDFFCAPFGASDVEAAPAHGWTANSGWVVVDVDPGSLRFRLARPVMGATVEKTVRLSEEAPLVCQTHEISGGSGGLTVAHHPMVRLGGRGTLSTSPKRAVLTAETALEPGRNALATGARSVDVTRVPAVAGGTVDLTRLPIAEGCEDFVTLVEAPGRRFGWTAIVRDDEDDVVFFLKDASVLPVTMLWHSNGGRDYPPWGGRHRGVVGIEDGCAAGASGHAVALTENPVSAEGVPTALALAGGRRHVIRHVMGAVPRPPGLRRVADIRMEDGVLRFVGDPEGDVELPFDDSFLRPDTT